MKLQRLIAMTSVMLALATAARAQTTPYVPIPNETGIGAGQRFINDINNRLSGAQAISPALVTVTFAQLNAIPEVNGWMFYCYGLHEIFLSARPAASRAPALGVRRGRDGSGWRLDLWRFEHGDAGRRRDRPARRQRREYGEGRPDAGDRRFHLSPVTSWGRYSATT